ncbi:hypothetical protein RJ641_018860 [Dillenia turbinata]|uniref:Uncharacterized protein n=1 Tax=Dillenia turbinata TaxID=194707 RepID=A0AAN8UL07_9MAGN
MSWHIISLIRWVSPKLSFSSILSELDVMDAKSLGEGMPITVGVGNLISEVGFSILTSPAAAGSVWKTLLSHGATPTGSNA